MIDAADAAVLVAPEKERRATVRAAMVHDADFAVRVAERDQVFAQQLEPQRIAVGLEFR
ncbi:hypothetical protein D3C83_242180 [compost metagenome]